jgi:hypothetical protein
MIYCILRTLKREVLKVVFLKEKKMKQENKVGGARGVFMTKEDC